MPTYHISIHGEPVRCDAQIKCRAKGSPVGSDGEVEHFEGTMREALDWAEQKNAEATGGNFTTSQKRKIPSQLDYDSRYNVDPSIKHIAHLRRTEVNRIDLHTELGDEIIAEHITNSFESIANEKVHDDDKAYNNILEDSFNAYDQASAEGLSDIQALHSAVTVSVQKTYELNKESSVDNSNEPASQELTDRFGKIVDLKNPEMKKYAESIAKMNKQQLDKERYVSAYDSTTSELIDAEEEYRENKAKTSNNPNVRKDTVDHSSPETLKNILEERVFNPNSPVLKKPLEEHYSTNAGKLNPSDFTGSGSEYIKPGENSLVIYTDRDGKGARAIASHSDFYEDPESELGSSVIQYKQYDTGTPDKKKLLAVVGYVGTDGKKYGYVPDKQVSMFVFK